MGIFSNAKAIADIQRIKNGGTANLSPSQITNLLINLPDAKKNLTEQQFGAVYYLYKEMNSITRKMKLDIDGYYEQAANIIKMFDKLAPYEKYSGTDELETMLLLKVIRDEV